MPKMLSLVVTSYNDCPIIRPHFQAIHEVLAGQTTYDWEVIFVDDGSSDGSAEELHALAKAHERVKVVELARNFGQQQAFMAGLIAARGDVVITLDGDFQYQPRCVLELAGKVADGFDIVSGVRARRRDPLFSRVTSAIGAVLIRRILRVAVSDFGAVKAFSRFLVDAMIQRTGYAVFPYSTAFSLSNRFAELPVEHLPRHSGVSKWSFAKRLNLYFDLYLAHAPYDGALGLRLVLLGLGGAVGAFAFGAPFVALWLVAAAGATFASWVFLGFCLRIHRQLLWGGQCALPRKDR